MELKELKELKPGSFKKFTCRFYNQREDRYINCIVLGLNKEKSKVEVYTDTGTIVALYHQVIKKVSITKSITPEARKIMKDFYAEYRKFQKDAADFDARRNAYNELYHHNERILPEAMGYLTDEEFVRTVLQNLPLTTKTSLEPYQVSIDHYGDTTLEFSYSKNLIKHFRRGSFVYEEYDGTIQLTDDCEKNKDYQRLIRLNRHPARLKIKPNEGLSVGDKEWLSYYCDYSFKLTEALTEKYAIAVAKKIS